MNPLTFLQNMTAADVQRYVRIALQWLAASLVTHGTIKADASWVEPVSGVIVGIASLAWTVYGNRLTAKIAEMAAIADKPKSPVQGVVLTPDAAGKAMSAKMDSPSVAPAGTAVAKDLAQP